MSAVVRLSALLEARQVWRGRAPEVLGGEQPTGWHALDTVLPAGGWPEAALSEILLPVDGVGVLRLLLPTLARLTQGQRHVVIVSPPHAPCVAGWRQQGVDMRGVEIVAASEKDVLWASNACAREAAPPCWRDRIMPTLAPAPPAGGRGHRAGSKSLRISERLRPPVMTSRQVPRARLGDRACAWRYAMHSISTRAPSERS